MLYKKYGIIVLVFIGIIVLCFLSHTIRTNDSLSTCYDCNICFDSVSAYDSVYVYGFTSTKNTFGNLIVITDNVDGRIFFNEKKFDSIKFLVSYLGKEKRFCWDTIHDKISNQDTLFLKENCIIHLKGYTSTDSIQKESDEFITEFNFEEALLRMLSTRNPALEKMFEVDYISPFRGTRIVVNGFRQSAIAYKSSVVVDCIKRGGKIISLVREDEHFSITDPNYPLIKEFEISNE